MMTELGFSPGSPPACATRRLCGDCLPSRAGDRQHHVNLPGHRFVGHGVPVSLLPPRRCDALGA